MAVKNSLPDLDFPVERLKNRADFLKARNGARSHERAFVLQLRKRTEDQSNICRVGFTVTKKTGNAVERNRIKRRLRAAIAAVEIPQIGAGCDAVFVARRNALTLPFDQLTEEVARSFAKAKLRTGRNNKPHIAN